MGRDTAPHLPVGISTQFVKCVRCGVRTLREPQPLSDVCCPGHGPPSCPVPVTAAMQGIVAQLANLLRSTLPWSSQRPTLPLRGSLHDGFGERCGYSVAFGWPTCASVIHTVLVLSSMQYQIRPPAVISYCHCSISVPFTDRRPSEPLSGCWRWSGRRGSWVVLSEAVRVFVGAAAQICSHPLTAPLFA